MKKLILISILAFISNSLLAQTLDRYLTIGPNTISYKGDLNQSYSKVSGGFNIQIVPNRDKLIQTTIGLNSGNIVGQNSGFYSKKNPQREPNTFFQTNFISISYQFRAYFYRRKGLKLFLGQGIGAIRFVPKDELGNKLIEQEITRNSDKETYRNIAFILPRTLGLSYTFKNEFGLSLDVTQLSPRTDYIDNISILGNSNDRDRVLMYRLSLMIPLLYRKE